MSTPIFVVMHGPTPQLPTGLWMSVRRRVEAFANAGIKTEVLIDHFSPDFDAQASHFESTSKHPERTRLRSMYRDLSGDDNYLSGVSYSSPLPGDGWNFVRDARDPGLFRGWESGKYKLFVSMRGEKVRFLDVLEDGRRVRRQWFDEAGLMCRADIMDRANRPALQRYFRRDGSVYLESHLDSTGTIRMISHREKSGLIRDFHDEQALFEYWMIQVLDGLTAPTIISEYGFRRQSLQKIESSTKGRVFFTLHNNHFGPPHTYGSPVKPELADLFDNIKELTGMIVLTSEQDDDIRKQFAVSNVHAIPHHVPKVERVGFRDPKKVVMVARFDRTKGQIDVLKAFRLVLEKVPDATLDFYGRGPDESEMAAQIRSLGLSESVTIKGFTSDSFQVFAESAISVVASQFEGYCLSLAESMACGCVPVSYDIKYGPRELIRDDVDGLLVPPNDLEAMAVAMTRLLKDGELREAMSSAATSVMERFAEARVVDAWRIALDWKP